MFASDVHTYKRYMYSQLSICTCIYRMFQTPQSFLQGPLQELVSYLNKQCSNDMQRARAYFRWLCTRDLGSLSSTGDDVSSDAPVANRLVEIRESKNQSNGYAKFFQRRYTELRYSAGHDPFVVIEIRRQIDGYSVEADPPPDSYPDRSDLDRVLIVSLLRHER